VACHPLVPELMGTVAPADGLQARFSARHGVAVGLLDGRAGLAQFSDARATQPDVSRLRAVTNLIATPDCDRDSVTITVHLTGGDDVEVHVAHARGSLARPLTDAELDAKVHDLVEPVLGAGAAAAIRRAVEGMATPTGFADLLAVARPKGAVA
jgi:2-methylcitrate dehydratase PrpD